MKRTKIIALGPSGLLALGTVTACSSPPSDDVTDTPTVSSTLPDEMVPAPTDAPETDDSPVGP